MSDGQQEKRTAITGDTGESSCEHCGVRFHCGAKDAQPCWCATQFPPVLKGRKGASGCLCPDCLRTAIAARDTT